MTTTTHRSPRDFVPVAFATELDEALEAVGLLDAFDNATEAKHVVRVYDALMASGYEHVARRLDRNMPNCFSR